MAVNEKAKEIKLREPNPAWGAAEDQEGVFWLTCHGLPVLDLTETFKRVVAPYQDNSSPVEGERSRWWVLPEFGSFSEGDQPAGNWIEVKPAPDSGDGIEYHGGRGYEAEPYYPDLGERDGGEARAETILFCSIHGSLYVRFLGYGKWECASCARAEQYHGAERGKLTGERYVPKDRADSLQQRLGEAEARAEAAENERGNHREVMTALRLGRGELIRQIEQAKDRAREAEAELEGERALRMALREDYESAETELEKVKTQSKNSEEAWQHYASITERQILKLEQDLEEAKARADKHKDLRNNIEKLEADLAFAQIPAYQSLGKNELRVNILEALAKILDDDDE